MSEKQPMPWKAGIYASLAWLAISIGFGACSWSGTSPLSRRAQLWMKLGRRRRVKRPANSLSSDGW